ncbi:hypothetical protein GC173_14475 [bacterium]|nr:hypothetical protein [bacterium]
MTWTRHTLAFITGTLMAAFASNAPAEPLHSALSGGIEVAAAATPVPTPTPRGTRGDLRDRRKKENWDANSKKVFGEYEGAKEYSLDAIRREDAALKPSGRFAVYTFDADRPWTVPSGFKVETTAGQAPGLWRVETNYDAPTGTQVVAQRNANVADRYTALLLERSPSARRIDISARVWIEDEGKDQAAGILVGSPGTAEGYALMIDSRGNKIEVQRIVKGKGDALPNSDLIREALKGTRKIETKRWYQLKMEYNVEEGNRSAITAYLDGVKVFEGRDNVFLSAGYVGMVASSSTRAFYDTFTVTYPENWTGDIATPSARPASPGTSSDAPLLSGSSTGTCQQSWTWDYNALDEQTNPPGMTSVALGEEPAGEWQVMADDVDNPRNIVQMSRIENRERYCGLLLDQRPFADFEVSARIRTKSGKSSQRLAGIVFRQVDLRNYYYAALHTGDKKVLLVRVANGKHQVIGSNKLDMKNNEWYLLKVIADGTNLRVMVDGDTKIKEKDNTLEVGKLGFITQSNTNAQFDDLSVCSYRND